MMRKVYPFFGAAAALSYLIAVVAGGFIAERGYNHLVHAISELPYFLPQTNGLRIDFLFTVYGWLLLAFALMAALDFIKTGRRLPAAAAILLVLNAASGLLMGIFMMDERGTAATFKGTMHLVLAGISAVASFLPPILVGIYGLKQFTRKGFAIYSLVSGGIVLVSGMFTAAGAANQVTYFGLIERITIGTYIIWVLVASVYLVLLYRKQKEAVTA